MKNRVVVIALVASFAYAGVVQAGQSNPVNLGSGVAMYDVPLFSIPQAPLSLNFRLFYHSQNPNRPTLIYLPMGLGWTHSFNETLAPTDGTGAVLYRITAEGWEEEYTTDGAGHWSASSPVEIRGTVTLASNEYTITDLNGQKTVFDAQTGSQTFGRWKRTVDRWGNLLFGTYTGPDLTSITDSVNRVLTLTYAAHQLTQVQLFAGGDTWRLQYTNGLLSGVFDPLHSGLTAWRTFSYQNNRFSILRLLTSAKDDANKSLQSFSYDASDRPVAASSEGGTDSMTIQYGVPTGFQTRVTRTQNGTLHLITDYTLIYQGSRWLVTKSEGGCTSCGVSGADTVSYQYFPNNHIQTKILGLDLTGSGGTDERAETDFAYDTNGMMTTRTEAVGKTEQRLTSFEHAQTGPTPPAWPAFVTKVTEVSVNPAHNKTTTNGWNGTETQLTTATTGYLSPTAGSPTTFTTVTNFDASHRPTSASGPRPSQLTSLAYYSNSDTTSNRRGRLQTQTVTVSASPPSTLVTTFNNYDLYGTAKSVIDPNLVETQRTTDSRGRVLTVIEKKPVSDPNEPPDYTTTYSFDTRDRLTQIQRPLGNLTRYAYENGTNRLVDTIRANSSGLEYERLHFTLNLLGGKTREDAQACAPPAANPCSAWSSASRTESFVYDGRNRLSEVDHPIPVGSKILYTYDSRGNLTKTQDERHTAPNTLYAFDFLSRLTRVTQKQILTPGSDVVTQYAYDARDDLTSATDPNGNVTTYTFDDWARTKTQASPVSGTTSYAHDEVGNLISSTDANTAVTTRVYDLANRVTSAASTLAGPWTETVTWTYDDPTTGNYGLGRLATMTDPAGSTTYAYERRDLLRSEGMTPSYFPAPTYTSRYGFDANGNRMRITYPSGRIVNYGFDFADRPISVSASAPIAQTYVSAATPATYYPFGPLRSMTFGNGTTTRTASYDQRYQPAENKLTTPTLTLADYTYVEDGVGNITSVTDIPSPTFNRTFGYDDLNRLTAANSGTSLWGTAAGNGYAYDLMGNVLSITLGSARTATFSYAGSTPNLSSVTETGLGTHLVSNDAAGNELSYVATRTYTPRNLQASFGIRVGKRTNTYSYGYDGRGLRTTSFAANGNLNATTGFSFYSPEFNLLSEGSSFVNSFPFVLTFNTDYIWFNGQPVAQENLGTSQTTRFTFVDHLGTPILQTDTLGAVIWRAEYEPYGNVFSFRTGGTSIYQPLRFPGQEVAWFTDGGTAPTEQSYNIFRWYRGGWGRYTQADPIDWKVVSGQQRDLFQLSFELPPSSSGQSTFAYALNSPARFRDPLGLSVAGGPNPIGTIIQQKMECGRRMATYALQRSATLATSPGFPGGAGGLHNGPGDAFRHCLWSCLMVQNCGGDTAFLAGWGHEIVQNHFWPPSESMMDASNNAQGRSCTECSSCETCCIAKMRTASLQLQP